MSAVGANATTAVSSGRDGPPAEAGRRSCASDAPGDGPTHRAAGWRERLLAVPAWAILVAAVLFAVDEWVYQRSGTSIVRQAPLDWIDHVLTTLFIVWAARPLFRGAWLAPALLASVLIDADHIPQHLGSDILTAGTARPYTHSLTTIVVLVAMSLPRSRWRSVAIGCAIGVASHLWRDLAEPRGSGVALLWPVSDQTITTPAIAYLGSVAALVIVAAGQAWARRPRVRFDG